MSGCPMAHDPLVVIGGGESAVCAISALREKGYAGQIVWVCGEDVHAYERPTLSKDFLRGTEAATVSAVPAGLLADEALDIRLGVTATGIDPEGHRVDLGPAGSLAYSQLLLATGARARDLDLPGRDPARWLTLRALRDAQALRSHLRLGRRIAIIGAGLIGLEMAAAAAEAGAAVTIIEAQDRPLARVLPLAIADIVLARHRAAGVAFHFGAAIAHVESGAAGERIVLGSGAEVVADIVLTAIGSTPNTELAERAGLAVANGILVDRYMRTAAPNVWASGDCARMPLALADGEPVRLESWEAARLQGDIAGRNMAGAREPADIVPWFWSDQFDLGIQGVGLAASGDVKVRRDLENGAALEFSIDPMGRLRAVAGVGPGNAVAKSVKRARQFIAGRFVCDVAHLADPATPLWSALQPPLSPRQDAASRPEPAGMTLVHGG